MSDRMTIGGLCGKCGMLHAQGDGSACLSPFPPIHVMAPCACCGGPVRRVNGEWLRFIRENKGLSLRSVARKAGVSAAFVSDVERGQRNWSDRLAKGYGIALKVIA